MSTLKLVFMGTPQIACPSLEAVVKAGHKVLKVYTQPDRPAGRGRRMARCQVAALADEFSLVVSQPRRIIEDVDELKRLEADVLCVMAFGQILPQAVLNAFPLGCVNVHTSLLPLLRGASPINQAIIQGHPQTGVTTMFMDAGMDTGDIIFQQSTDVGPQETAGSLAQRLSQMGAEILLRTLDALAAGDAPRVPQDHGRATYAPLLKKSDGLVAWDRPAVELDCLLRGLDPWPTAYTTLDGQPLKLFAPTALSSKETGQVPGSLVEPPDGREDFIWIACGQGALGVGQAQAAGKKRMPALQFLRGARLGPGVRLGE